MVRSFVLPGLLLAGCAAPPGVAVPPTHPASAAAPAVPLVVSAAPLAPVPAPDLPAVLRPSAHEAFGHGMAGMDRGQRPHGSVASAASGNALRSVLDAYLAVHDTLVADQMAPEASAALAEAVVAWTATPPADAPHIWHRQADAVAAVRQSADALAEAGDLSAARAAFSALSVPFAALVEATGVPAGVDLARFTCGMADAPEGGVWLQPAGPARNPYLGPSMAMCGTRDAAVPSATEMEMGHDGMGTHR